MLVTPFPFAAQPGLAIPGLIADAASFESLVAGWDELQMEQRYQLLDDAAATMRLAPDEPELVRRVETQVFQWHMGHPDYHDEDLLGDIVTALRGMEAAGRLHADRAHKILFAGQRLLTRVVDGRTGPSLLIRCPARSLADWSQDHDLMREFGKVVPLLWQEDREAAHAAFRRWVIEQAAATGSNEIHTFTTSAERAALFENRLIDESFEVRRAIIPQDLKSFDDPTKALPPGAETYWVIGRASVAPLSLWLNRFLRSGPDPAIRQLDLADRQNIALDDPDIGSLLRSIFGRPLALREVLNGFSIDVPGYVTQRVQLAREGEGGVSILSEITNGDGQLVARLVGHLPAIPEPGEPWIAWGEDLNEQLHHRLQPHEIARHMQKGIGRRAMQKVLGLLYHLGVNGLEMRARLQGLAFMPHIGFDFADQQTRERIATAFYRYLLRMEYSLSPQKEEEFSRLRHAWQFVDFQLDDGTHVGREFFDYYGRVEQGHMRLIFWLQPDYTGWRRLFRRQLKHLEEGSAPSVQEVWDRRHAVTNRHHLVERLTELVYGSRPGVQASLLHDPDVPVRIREQFAGLADLALYFEGEARAARKHADHDSMTGLLNKRALLRHNRELEIAMESQRSADSTNDHWVLMIDIDHFKLVNDRHGHLVGDIALQRVARILERVAREYDLVCRYGGEEFCIVLRHAGREGVRRVAESIRAAVESEPVPTGRGSSVQITTSVGASPFRVIPSEGENGGANPFAEENDEPTSLTASIHDADQALYRAKHGGRNRVVYSV